MLRRDEICGYLRAVIQGCEPRGQSNKSLISLTGAAGLEPTIGAPVQVSVYPRETGAVSVVKWRRGTVAEPQAVSGKVCVSAKTNECSKRTAIPSRTAEA